MQESAAPPKTEEQGRPAATGTLRSWMLACRPATLTCSIAPVLVGTACAFAHRAFRLGPALAALFGAIAIQIGTNLANDVADFLKGADNSERLGPVRAAQAGLLSPAAVRTGAIVAFSLAALAGLYLVFSAGPILIAVGLASILCGVAYTAGPYPLGYHGLGELFVLLFFGFVAVCGTAYVQMGSVPVLAVWASIPAGALSSAVLVVNNLRDRDTDAKAGKRTLAVRLGVQAAVAEYALLVAAAYAAPLVIAVLWRNPWALLPLVTLPRGIQLARRAARAKGRELNPVLANTAKLLLWHSLLFAGGIMRGS
ncbi:MAG: 1,4-dihydroxy-2-naphthoate polyprenyltransferase [Pseudomonadota bacterium]